MAISTAGRAQDAFDLKPQREAVLIGTGLALHGFGLWKEQRSVGTTLSLMDARTVPTFDRIATRLWSLPAHRAGNVLFGMAVGASLATAVWGTRAEKPLVPLVIVLESGLITSGLTNTVKELVGRERPYLYNPDAPPGAIRGHEDQLSFWSGHTANAAAITFSTAALVQRSDASTGLRTATWIGAALVPAAMGYLRVRSGRHFPTDVLAGYAVGAAVGIAVPYFHRAGKGMIGN